MQYILTIWLLWAGTDYDIIQVSSFASIEACTSYATSFTEKVVADGVIASRWVCKPEEIQDA